MSDSDLPGDWAAILNVGGSSNWLVLKLCDL